MVSGNKKHSSERKKYEPKAKSSFINKTNEAGNNISSVEPKSDVFHKNEEDEVNETGEQNTSVEEKPNVPPASNIVENGLPIEKQHAIVAARWLPTIAPFTPGPDDSSSS